MEMVTHFACFVSSATWPEASKPVSVPAVKRLRGNIVGSRMMTHPIHMTYKDRIQFHPGGAPVPLSVRCVS
jgi:hypothetical protein